MKKNIRLILLLLPIFLFGVFGLFIADTLASAYSYFYTITATNDFCCVSGYGDSKYYYQEFTATTNNISEIGIQAYDAVNNEAFFELWADDGDGSWSLLKTTTDARVDFDSGAGYVWQFDYISLTVGVIYKIKFYNVFQPQYEATTATCVAQNAVEFGHSDGYHTSDNCMSLHLGADFVPSLSATSILIPEFAYSAVLKEDYPQIFRYRYRTDVGIGSGDYITGELCDSSVCATSTPVIFDTGSATSTTFSILYNPLDTYGKSYFFLDSPTDLYGTSTAKTLFYRITPYYQTASSTLQGDYSTFVISWNPENDFNAYGFENFATSTQSIFGTSAHDLACSSEDWIEAASSTDWFNWTSIRCRGAETFLNIVYKIVDVARSAVIGLGDIMKNLFPFSLVVSFSDCWQSSASSTLPVELSFLDITDEAGDAYITIPAEWTGTASSSQVAVWGTSVFTPPGSALASFFAGIRTLSKYLMWALFIFGIYKLGKKAYEEINS